MEPTDLRSDKGRRTSRELADSVSVLPESARWKLDPEHMLGIVGIVGAVLNLLVVVFVYIYSPI